MCPQLILYTVLPTCGITEAGQNHASGRCEIQIAHYCQELGSFDLQIVIAFIFIVMELLFFFFFAFFSLFCFCIEEGFFPFIFHKLL